MLSNNTKLERINEKLYLIGAKLEWACFDLNTYTPTLINLNGPTSIYFSAEGYTFRLKTFVLNNKVVFTVGEIPNITFKHYEQFNRFCMMIKMVKDILDSCNKYELEVPKYLK